MSSMLIDALFVRSTPFFNPFDPSAVKLALILATSQSKSAEYIAFASASLPSSARSARSFAVTRSPPGSFITRVQRASHSASARTPRSLAAVDAAFVPSPGATPHASSSPSNSRFTNSTLPSHSTAATTRKISLCANASIPTACNASRSTSHSRSSSTPSTSTTPDLARYSNSSGSRGTESSARSSVVAPAQRR